jgi:FAD/FMN-containing dehydrogenase
VSPFSDLDPGFEGSTFGDGPGLADAARDFGGLVEHRPVGVLRPRSEEDVVRAIRFARTRRLPLAIRGAGHSTHGQSQAPSGIVLDMRSMSRVLTIDEDEALVEGGALWEGVLLHSLVRRRCPPVLTDYLGLTVGGTLAVGGVGIQSCREGMQVDQVTGLRVVTGDATIVDCSPADHADLFFACLAGLGQCGVIVQARIGLVAAPAWVRIYRSLITDLGTLIAALRWLAAERSFDGLQAAALLNDADVLRERLGRDAEAVPGDLPAGRWLFLLEAAEYMDARGTHGPRLVLPGLPIPPLEASFLRVATRLGLPSLTPAEGNASRHPWINLLLPVDRAPGFLDEALDGIGEETARCSPILFYVIDRSRARTPLFRTPDADWIIKFSLLKNLLSASAEEGAAEVAANRRLYERARAAGGTRYPIDSVPMTHEDWRAHFGPTWEGFAAAKARYDPDQVLSPHQHVFASPSASDEPGRAGWPKVRAGQEKKKV